MTQGRCRLALWRGLTLRVGLRYRELHVHTRHVRLVNEPRLAGELEAKDTGKGMRIFECDTTQTDTDTTDRRLALTLTTESGIAASEAGVRERCVSSVRKRQWCMVWMVRMQPQYDRERKIIDVVSIEYLLC